MICGVVRVFVAAFCLLSLLAAAEVSWLWWEVRHGRGYVAEGSLGGTYVMVSSEASDVRVGVAVIRGWPGRRFVWVGSYREYKERELLWIPARMRRWERMHLFGQAGEGSLIFQPGTGEPLRQRWGRIPYATHSWPSCSARGAAGRRC